MKRPWIELIACFRRLGAVTLLAVLAAMAPAAAAAQVPRPGSEPTSTLAVGDTIVSRELSVRVDTVAAPFVIRQAFSREFALRADTTAFAFTYRQAFGREVQVRTDTTTSGFVFKQAFSRDFEVRHADVYTPFAFHEAFARPFLTWGQLLPAAVEDVPLVFAFHPPAPNPVRTGALLRFDLPTSRVVTVEVLDVQGRRVLSLADRRAYPPGRHALRLDRGRLPSGLYFVRLRAGELGGTRRLVVIE